MIELSTPRPSNEPDTPTAPPTFREATRTWAYISVNSFGGPAGQIAVMHRVLVDEKRWVSEERFLHALNYCMLLPGPEAQQLATYIGWLLHGVRGGLVAGTLFILPGMLAILTLSYLYVGFHDIVLIQGLFFGLKAAVLAIVAEAVLRIGKRALKTRFSVAIAAAGFISIFFFAVPFPIVVATAAGVGLLHRFLRCTENDPPSSPATKVPKQPRLMGRSVTVITVWCALWFTPLALIFGTRGSDDVYFQIGTFFSKAAVVTFGGAYSVLSYIGQEAVDTYHWLQPGEMLDGLAMAETTPGPLIMVVQFVGFMAAYRDPGGLPPMLAGTLAGLLTTWVTFTPCFLWIFLGAPYIEVLRGNKSLNAALSAITAAVVGVVLNLSVWFTLHTLFRTVTVHTEGPFVLQVPDLSTLDWAALLLTTGAMLGILKFRTGMFKTLAACAVAGLLYKTVLG